MKPEEQTSDVLVEKLQICMESNKQTLKCPEFDGYEYDSFKNIALAEVEDYAKLNGMDFQDVLCESFFYYLSASLNNSLGTGLVFVGYLYYAVAFECTGQMVYFDGMRYYFE